MDRELSAFLVQLSIALHKSAAYPARHPLVRAAVDAVHQGLGGILSGRETFSIGVARTHLIVGGVESDADQPLLRDLAQRLYRRGIGGVTFARGLDAQEVAELIAALAAEAAPEGPPPEWPHVRIHPLAFDQLEIAEGAAPGGGAGPDESKLRRLWAELAESALGERAPPRSETLADGRTIADAINTWPRDAAYAEAVTSRLVELGRWARESEGADTQLIRSQLGLLLANLEPAAILRLLDLGTDARQREQVVSELSRAMPVSAVLDLVRSSAGGGEQTISHSLLRIFTKLAAHGAGEGATDGEGADAVRDMVAQMVEGWQLKDPNPPPYSRLLEDLAKARRAQRAALAPAPASAQEALRVVQMGLEVGVAGPAVEEAVDALVREGELVPLLDLLARAPEGDPAADAAWSRLSTADVLRRVLAAEEPDPAIVERLLPRLGMAAAEPMLDTLIRSESRTTRRRLLGWLRQLGPGIGPLAVAHLGSPHWYVQRNMLVLLAGLDTLPSGFSPMPYLAHADARVRREALRIALKVPALRDQGIRAGLADPDEQMLRMALGAGLEGCPREAVPLLVRRLSDERQPSDLRVLLLRVLGAAPSTGARDYLLQRVLVRRRWLGGKRLAAKSPELVAAVAALAARWAGDAAVAEALRLAARSGDPEIRAAAGPRRA